jgi:peptidoglycan-associated lipoprotein
MTMTRSRALCACAALILALTITACARRPAVTQAAAPPPTAAAPPAPAPAAIAPAPAPAAAAPAPAPAPAPAAPAPEPPAATATARPAPQDFAAEPALPDIHFDFDKSVIRPDAAKILQTSADWLKARPGHVVLIEGHCDDRGTDAYNLALGDRRAKAARDFLLAHGVAAPRITVISYGEQRPQCTARSEECWSRNRRAHFLVKPE